MATLDSRFRVNEPDVIAESVDGEVLIINLRSGAYYSSDGAGDQIWGLVSLGFRLSDVAARLRSHYVSGPDGLEAAVLAFAIELEDEGLIVSEPTPAASAEMPPPAPPGAAFVPPVLHKYTDFQELLLLDPIHEVDDAAGWPTAQPS